MDPAGEILLNILLGIANWLYKRFDLDLRPWWVRMLFGAGFFAMILGLIFLILHLILTYYKNK